MHLCEKICNIIKTQVKYVQKLKYIFLFDFLKNFIGIKKLLRKLMLINYLYLTINKLVIFKFVE